MTSRLKLLTLVVFILGINIAQAKTISTPSKPIVATTAESVKRVCYYQDQAYSEGAIIQVGDYLLQCTTSNEYELNGALKWQTRLNSKSSEQK